MGLLCKKIDFSFIFFISIVFLYSPVPAYARESPQISILFFNDLHGYLRPFSIKTPDGKKEVGGIARISTLINNIRKENTQKGIKTYVFVAGDILQGTPLSTIFKGESAIKCLNAMGVDAMTIGNHEFDFGLDNFLKLQKMAHFPFLSSNVHYRDTQKLLGLPFTAFQVIDDLWLTVIGATTNELLTTTKPENVVMLDVYDSVVTVNKSFSTNTTRGPVMLLSHSKFKTDQAIAQSTPKLAAIIGGHDQVLFFPFRKVGNVEIFQAFEKGQYLGRLDLKIDQESHQAKIVNKQYLPINASIQGDPEIEKIIHSYYSQIENQMKVVIGSSSVFLDGERGNVRFNETNLGNFVTDIMRQYTGAEIAFINSGSIRSSIQCGDITMEQIFTTMPFSNEIITVDLQGDEILKVLNRSVKGNKNDEDGGFLQVSGVKFSIFERSVNNVLIGKNFAPLQTSKKYTVAISDFLFAGGDGYSIFKDKEPYKTGLPLKELLVDTIRSRKNISPEVEGRITRKSAVPH